MIFNVGARRSGTYLLQRAVASHSQISPVPSETSLFSHGIAPLFDRFQYAARSSPQVGAVYVDHDAVLDATRDLCDVVFAEYLESASRYVAERTAVHVLHLDLITQVYPDARIIHIIRDGRDVARSLIAQPWGPSTVRDAAAEWRASITGARALEIPADRYREIRYEDLISDTRATLVPLFEWLDVPITESAVAAALNAVGTPLNVDRYGQPGTGSGKWQSSLRAADLDAFNAVAGDLLRELGYESSSAVQSGAPGGRLLHSMKVLARTRRRRVTRGRAVAERNELRKRQQLTDRVVAALLGNRVAEVESLLASNVRVKVVSRHGEEEAHGADGGGLLAKAIAEDPVLTAKQVRGDTYPGGSTTAYVMSFVPEGEAESIDRAIFVNADGRAVRSVAIYQFPLNTT
jgi:hypothetical protein